MPFSSRSASPMRLRSRFSFERIAGRPARRGAMCSGRLRYPVGARPDRQWRVWRMPTLGLGHAGAGLGLDDKDSATLMFAPPNAPGLEARELVLDIDAGAFLLRDTRRTLRVSIGGEVVGRSGIPRHRPQERRLVRRRPFCAFVPGAGRLIGPDGPDRASHAVDRLSATVLSGGRPARARRRGSQRDVQDCAMNGRAGHRDIATVIRGASKMSSRRIIYDMTTLFHWTWAAERHRPGR